MEQTNLKIRKASEKDITLLYELINGLASYEKRPNDMTASIEDLEYMLFKRHIAPAVIVENNEGSGQVVADILKRYYEYENLYYDAGKKTGYQYIKACESGFVNDSKHYFHIGQYLPEVIDEIGDGIDFIILDTVHKAPGELMDLLVCLPYMSPNLNFR